MKNIRTSDHTLGNPGQRLLICVHQCPICGYFTFAIRNLPLRRTQYTTTTVDNPSDVGYVI